uniref:Protein kinase domain-containing protein n=1 Tax=Strongyloides venezuelensis TaxID=75913 RepID=A0A0K0FRA1_STRVS
MNRNVKYRSIAYGTWHIGDARKFVEEKFNGSKNNKCDEKQSSIFSPKNGMILNKIDKNLLSLKISSDGSVTFKDDLRSVTPIMEISTNMKSTPSFDHYNLEDNSLTVSTTEANSFQFDSLNKRKKISINNQHSMADSGIADNSDSSPEGDWFSSSEYIQYCQKMQQTANTEDDFSFSSTIANTKKDDNNHHHCSLETIYQNSVSPYTNNITMTKKKNNRPTITNKTHLKTLKDNSKFTIKNVPLSKMRTSITGPSQMIPTNNDYNYNHQQLNSLNYCENNLIYNLPNNTIHFTNYHKPYYDTKLYDMANTLPQQNNKNSVNCIPFSMVNDSMYDSHGNSNILDDNTRYYNTKTLFPYDKKLNDKSNSIDKRRAKSVEIGNTHSTISNDQGYNTMRIKNFTNLSNNTKLYNNKHDSLKNWKNDSLTYNNCDNKKDKAFSAIKSTKKFFQRIFTNPTSTLPRKWKNLNDKSNLNNEEIIIDDWTHMNALTTLHKYGTIHRTKTDINFLINNYDILRKQYQQNGYSSDFIYPFTIDNIYKDLKDLSIPQSSSQKSSSDSCYTSTISSNSPTHQTTNKILIGKIKVEESPFIRDVRYYDKVYPSFENFKNWNEIYHYLKNELQTIKEKDHRILENLRYTEKQLNEYKKSLV